MSIIKVGRLQFASEQIVETIGTPADLYRTSRFKSIRLGLFGFRDVEFEWISKIKYFWPYTTGSQYCIMEDASQA